MPTSKRNTAGIKLKVCATCGCEIPRVHGHAQGGIRRAAQAGNVLLVQPKPNELQIDLDGARALHIFAAQWSILSKYGVITSRWKQKITPSQTKGHVHVTVTAPFNMDDRTRVCYQTVLGDDITRAAFNLARVEKGNKFPIVFFERTKDKRAGRTTHASPN